MTSFQKNAKGPAVARNNFPPRKKEKTMAKKIVRSREVWILEGQISAGKRRTNDVSRFKIVLETYGESQARSKAFQELLEIARKKEKDSRGSNILFEKVSLRNGERRILLRPEFANRRFLAAKPSKVFGGVVAAE